MEDDFSSQLCYCVSRGSLSPRALDLVTEWADLHRAELMQDWALARGKRNSTRLRRWRELLKEFVFASPLDGHRLRTRSEDGVEGVGGLGEIVSFRGAFAPPKDPAYFSQLRAERLERHSGPVFGTTGLTFRPFAGK